VYRGTSRRCDVGLAIHPVFIAQKCNPSDAICGVYFDFIPPQLRPRLINPDMPPLEHPCSTPRNLIGCCAFEQRAD
jgi:hypothetical protein